MKSIIYTAGYPKSGTVYLTRLLGDVLNSTTGAYWPRKNHEEITAQTRPGPYDIRRGHYVIEDAGIEANCVPRPHVLNFHCAIGGATKIVHIVRDPRDIVVSAYHYFKIPTLDKAVTNMLNGTGNFRGVGSWQEYMNPWLNLPFTPWKMFVRFQDLVNKPEKTIALIMGWLDLERQTSIKEAVERQSFARAMKRIEKSGSNLAKHHMRKGIAGDWKNHLSPKQDARIRKALAHEMRIFRFT